MLQFGVKGCIDYFIISLMIGMYEKLLLLHISLLAAIGKVDSSLLHGATIWDIKVSHICSARHEITIGHMTFPEHFWCGLQGAGSSRALISTYLYGELHFYGMILKTGLVCAPCFRRLWKYSHSTSLN